MTYDELIGITHNIYYRDWRLLASQKPTGGNYRELNSVFLQWMWAEVSGPLSRNPFTHRKWQDSRLFYVGELPDVTEEQLVRAAWALLQIAIEHETRELFWYGDTRPFEPHQQVIR